jgi:oligopeptide/dipeptide ABC transporter ATP-binding protein
VTTQAPGDAHSTREVVAQVDGLEIMFRTRHGDVQAVDGADLVVRAGEKLGVVGESGSGKTTMAMALGRLLPVAVKHIAGRVLVGDRSVLDLGEEDLRKLRRRELAYIFQDPAGTLDPTMRIRDQLKGVAPEGASRDDIAALLRQVGLGDAKRVAASYPHELSGGMAQRVSIAMAIARDPRLIVADEPTAALDASIRRQVLELLMSLCDDRGIAIMLLSHDLRAVTRHCDTVAVMYGGRVVESGASARIFCEPAHPYTAALLRSAPGAETFGGRIEPIAGVPPVLTGPSRGCAFAPRCAYARPQCLDTRPALRRVAGRDIACHRAEEIAAAAIASERENEGHERARRPA